MIEIKKSIHDTEDRFCNEIEVQRRNQTNIRKEKPNTPNRKYGDKPQQHAWGSRNKNI